ncbi:MAG: hypothetical protein IJX92_05470 [Clostridia bacterium]|nr:hypothetical protein [Clostridia bacterium]
MKFNKILSSALVLMMLFTSIVSVIPFTASAQQPSGVTVVMGEVDESVNSRASLQSFVKEYLSYNYTSADKMLADELEKGYLDSISAAGYNLYVNRYTGFVYYQNTKTGQILTSNPVDPYYASTALSNTIMSQIEIEYSDLSNPTVAGSGSYNSLSELNKGFALNVTEIAEQPDGRKGISVQYALGVNAADFRVPATILATDFVDNIAKPMFAKIVELMNEYCGAPNGVDYDLNNYAIHREPGYHKSKVINAVDTVQKYAENVLGVYSDEFREMQSYFEAVKVVFSNYSRIDPANLDKDRDKILFETIPAVGDGNVVYRINSEDLTTYRLVNNAISKILAELYTKDEAKADQAKTGYVSADVNSASFLVSINYTLNANGELYYEVPMSEPYFVNNNTNYTVKSITALKYFGAGDKSRDGYIFFPDGSGAVVEFDDIRTIQPSYTVPMYGEDYGYATIGVTRAHLEQTTVPVYGLVTDANATEQTKAKGSSDTVTNGFFSIVEEGSALTSLGFASGGSTHKYAMTYSIYNPQPTDICDLSETISVSGLGFYYIASESVYEGSFKTKVTMLTDKSAFTEDVGGYDTSYVGMAECYRDYLKGNNILTAIKAEDTTDSVPLYIETLGAMDVTKKILSFPVVISTPLTTFSDVEDMYNELSGSGVKNINFRLTGYANGGMSFTYPAKVWWQGSLGGDNGFKDLLSVAEDVNAKASEGYNFGVYPDFDFLYIAKEELFDGVSRRSNAALMVDNRYASKQVYNSVLQEYESLFTLVVSSDSYEELYEKFLNDYSKYDATGLSVATLGSDLNSNFDKENAINRERSLGYVKSLFAKMKSDYSVMTDAGNIYAMQYVDHVLNAPIDSSHYMYSSYTVPFYGLVFHGYVNYAGSPINYSGSSDYEILRSIENGASLYYILCYQNTNYLKDDPDLSKYYGVDYHNWKDEIVEQYKVINEAIGDLQTAEIVDHIMLTAERLIDREEVVENYDHLITEFAERTSEIFEDAIASAAADLREDPEAKAKYAGIAAVIDKASVVAKLLSVLNVDEQEAKEEVLTVAELADMGIAANADMTLYDVVSKSVSDIVTAFETAYPGANDNSYAQVALDSGIIEYKSKYNYITTSYATDDDYVTTEYTCSSKNVAMVTYRDTVTGEETVFILNYNVYSVKLKLDADVHTNIANYVDKDGCITLDGSGYVKIQ